MLENLTGFGTEGISLMLMLFGLASVPGTLLGGYAADRWGYKHSMATALTILAVSLCTFSVVFVANAGSTVAIVESGVVLITWST